MSENLQTEEKIDLELEELVPIIQRIDEIREKTKKLKERVKETDEKNLAKNYNGDQCLQYFAEVLEKLENNKFENTEDAVLEFGEAIDDLHNYEDKLREMVDESSFFELVSKCIEILNDQNKEDQKLMKDIALDDFQKEIQDQTTQNVKKNKIGVIAIVCLLSSVGVVIAIVLGVLTIVKELVD